MSKVIHLPTGFIWPDSSILPNRSYLLATDLSCSFISFKECKVCPFNGKGYACTRTDNTIDINLFDLLE